MTEAKVGIPIKESENLTAEQQQLKQLFYLSYYFSQGRPFTQERLFDWLIATGHLPLGEITQSIPDFITKTAPPPVHIPKDVSETGSDLVEVWGKLVDKTNTGVNLRKKESPQKLVEKIALCMIGTDIDYQYTGRPLRDTKASFEPDSNPDPYKSFFRRYSVNLQSTGTEAFDSLFREMARLTQRQKPLSPGKEIIYSEPEDLEEIVDRLGLKQSIATLWYKWEQHHPGQSFFPQVQETSKVA